MMDEEYWIGKLRELIKDCGSHSEDFHPEYDVLLREIIEDELKFKKFFEVLSREYHGSFWYE